MRQCIWPLYCPECDELVVMGATSSAAFGDWWQCPTGHEMRTASTTVEPSKRRINHVIPTSGNTVEIDRPGDSGQIRRV